MDCKAFKGGYSQGIKVTISVSKIIRTSLNLTAWIPNQAYCQ